METVERYQFGQSEPQAPATLSGLDRLGERLARHLRVLLEPSLGAKPNVTAQLPETQNYDLWSAMAPNFSAYNVYRLHPLKGAMLLRMDAAMVSGLVERYFGGGGGRPGPARTEFTASENRTSARLADAVMAALVGNLSDLLPLEYAPLGREHDPQTLTFADANDQMLVQTFTIDTGRTGSWTMELLFPLVALRQLEPLLAGHGSDDVRKSDPLWQARIAQQMTHIRLPAKTVLARPSLSLTELLSLKPGDVIPVNVTRQVPLIVGNTVIAKGTLGEQNGHAAFRIEKLN